ncbi:nuclear-interacting partner of ALK isoform X2 [Notechis scutatus]|uniref:Nuclear-interacting partner of ALK isoform X2 n=1 Tax=Notechis scutatus TaxID=8663 RepID=A0A6J1VPL0_9SAUR|nr:nuclear-interacting partner of ALK isoform X2 [Notechis scutatus]
MAAPSPAAVAAAAAAAADAPENESGALATKPKSPAITPQKVRELIDEGIAPEEAGQDRKDSSAFGEVANGSPQTNELHFESTSKEAFFNRVETFTSLKWAGKPHELSPLICAKYGWTNVECDMLKCSSCQAYLCASLQLAFDFSKYKERCLELQKALLGAHEKFCFWPDSPCPDRFSVLLVEEPHALCTDFLERFRNLCQLQLQLPSLKPDSLKNVSLTEDKVSFLLQLIEEKEKEEEENRKTEGEKTSAKPPSDLLQVHITASILALCGWTGSPPSGSVHLPLISCSRCMRKVGLWSFHQMESTETELENLSNVAPVAEKPPLGPTSSPRRMITRSQDTSVPLGSEQHEKSPSPVISRTRGGDSFSEHPEAEAASPTPRSRPVTRSMGHGEACGPGAEVPSSPHRKAKRPRLYSSGSSDSLTRVFFDPLAQHRDWCPWVNEVKEATGLGTKGDSLEEKADRGWQVVLKVLQASGQSEKPAHLESESLSTKSRKVFQIFRQWEAACSS